MPLARSCARRYAGTSEPNEDLDQVAFFALVKAVDRFDPSHGTSFSTYAVPTIIGELKRHFRDRSWAVRPPRSLQENFLRVEQATKQLASRTGRAPTIPELAEHLVLSEEEVLEAMQARDGQSAISLSRPMTSEDDGHTLGDSLGDTDGGYALADDRAELTSLMKLLPARDRRVLELRFEQDMTQAEIGAVIGVSQMQVSRIIRSSLVRLRAAAGPRT
jgi:RNA polymerase sigma-B factor